MFHRLLTTGSSESVLHPLKFQLQALLIKGASLLLPLFPVASGGSKLIILASQGAVQKAMTHFFEIFYKVHSTRLPFSSKLSSCGSMSQYPVS